MTEEAARLERIIKMIVEEFSKTLRDILEAHLTETEREGIDAVVSGFDVGGGEDE